MQELKGLEGERKRRKRKREKRKRKESCSNKSSPTQRKSTVQGVASSLPNTNGQGQKKKIRQKQQKRCEKHDQNINGASSKTNTERSDAKK